MRFFARDRDGEAERLLWTRDGRFARTLAARLLDCRVLDLEAGSIVVAPAAHLVEPHVSTVADEVHSPEYGIVDVDGSLPVVDRYVVALSAAVQASGLADRIGMAQTTQTIQTKMLDYFFAWRDRHATAFQPIVDMRTGEAIEYECLFRPDMPMLPQSISAIVQAALDTERSIELDRFIVSTILARVGALTAARRSAGRPAQRFALNLTPASLLDPAFEAAHLARMVHDVGLDPALLTIECTEQQSVTDVGPLRRQVKALRRLGFGFAVDDAGAGYASFKLIADLKPSVIKIDREIVHGIARDEARRALVEAFVSFGRRIDAHLVAEGVERRADLAALEELGIRYVQGYLLGRPWPQPLPPRPAARRAAARPTSAAPATTRAVVGTSRAGRVPA